MPKEFEVPNLQTWDRLYNSIEIKEYSQNYQSWIQNKSLEDNQTFIKAVYPDLVDGDKPIVQVLHEKIFKVTQANEVMHKNLVQEYSNFLLEYGEQVNAISKDIDSLNASNKNIEAMLNKITQEATYFLGDEIFTKLYEAENNQQSNPQEEKEKQEKQFRSADPNDQNAADNKKKAAQDRKYIVTYYKASTQVFSAKLKTCNAVKGASEKIVSNFIKLQIKGGGKEETKEQPTAQVNNQQGSTEIKK